VASEPSQAIEFLNCHATPVDAARCKDTVSSQSHSASNLDWFSAPVENNTTATTTKQQQQQRQQQQLNNNTTTTATQQLQQQQQQQQLLLSDSKTGA
jgi:hypothetical protein